MPYTPKPVELPASPKIPNIRPNPIKNSKPLTTASNSSLDFKPKNEIIGSTSKIYAQKGTGNARHASRKAPIFVGGGVAHGPKGELSHKIRKLNKSEKKQSIASIISEKKNLNNLFIFSDFLSEIKKTKEMNIILKKFDILNAILILDNKSYKNVIRSLKNIPNIKVTDVNHFSAFDLIKYKKLIFTESSVKELEKRYS